VSLFNSGVIPIINDHILAESKKLRDYGDYWSASSAGYCMRLNIMRRLGVPAVPEIEEAKARTQRVFSAGHIFHSWVQGLTREAGVSIAQELELQDEDLMVRGHFDDLILIADPSKTTVTMNDDTLAVIDETAHLILYDYKTVNSQSFKYKKDKISSYHRMQLGTYMHMLRHTKLVDLPPSLVSAQGVVEEARILNISKDDLRMSEFQLFWDDKLEKDVLDYWTALNAHWKARTMPRCTCAELEGGFMGKRSAKGKVYNDFFWEDEPCSLVWYDKCKKEGLITV
jgi:hypothetical protein